MNYSRYTHIGSTTTDIKVFTQQKGFKKAPIGSHKSTHVLGMY